MKMIKKWLLLSFLVVTLNVSAQVAKPIRGVVVDNASGEVLISATITVLNSNPVKGTVTNIDGEFAIDNLPVGRYDLQASFIGYEPMIFREILLSTAKETYLTFSLKETLNKLEEVVVTPKVNKQESLNKMTSASARMLSVEEASRYAGAGDDPARLVTSFAGVAGNVSSNGIAVRGNSPQSLQWKLEGVEIPNPTHFPDVTGLGGGILTALSSQVLGNSDFLTGAFPAEYSNALSGVFDMQLRNGNRWQRESTFKFGALGIDIASEGPFKKGGEASYIFNYRYSTMTLVDQLFPGMLGMAAGMGYQDLSFKLNFPTKRAGTFSIWGFGVIDNYTREYEEDTLKWEKKFDQLTLRTEQWMGAGGVSHKYQIDNSMYVKTVLATTYKTNHIWADWHNRELQPFRINDFKGTNTDLVFNTYLNKKFSAKHTNRTGVNATALLYDLNMNRSPDFGTNPLPMNNFAKSNGSTMLYSAFSNSTISINDRLTANVGLNTLYFVLNKEWSIEPRVGLKMQLHPKHSVGIAYGKHSRHEKVDYYFVSLPHLEEGFPNKKLKLGKADHYVMSYDWSISNDLHLKIEPYYQHLYNIPLAKDGSFSLINYNEPYLNHLLITGGKGRNYGIDLTLEKYLSQGYYYMLTGSLFDSKYKDQTGLWRNTRLNRNFLINVLGGKEWALGKNKQNILGVNLRASYQGGDRYTPADEAASIQQEDVIEDESRPFANQLSPALTSSLTVSYKMNKKKLAHEFAIKVVNINGYKEFSGYRYNYKEKRVIEDFGSVIMPDISYKIEF